MKLKSGIDKYLNYLEIKEASTETIRGYRILLYEFDRFVCQHMSKSVSCKEVLIDHIEAFLAYRKEKGDQATSRNRHYYILRGFFGFLVKRDIIIKNPVIMIEPVKLHVKERHYLSIEQIEKLIKAIDNETIKTAVQMIAYTGMRVSEVCNLRHIDIDWKHNILNVISGKGNKDRVIPMSEKLTSILDDFVGHDNKRKKSEFFFSTNRYHSISPDYINRELKKASIQIDLLITPTAHVLRHSFASELVKRKASLPSIQKILGHADLRITSRYIHQNVEQLREAVDLIF